jgi:arylsulfatase A-like enzyme
MMIRRPRLILSSLLLLALAALAWQAQAAPNILMIVADDLGIEATSPYGSLDAETPNLMQLARQGTRYAQFHVQSFCVPTRLQLITGRYAYRGSSGATPLPHVLEQAGYRARVLIGKWHIQNHWDTPRHAGYSDYFTWTHSASRYWAPVFSDNGQRREYGSSVFGPNVMADKVDQFLMAHRNDTAPWLLSYHLTLPHSPIVRVPGRPFDGTEAEKTRDMVWYMDKLVGRVLAQLDVLNIASKTLVIFMGDNGSDLDARNRMPGGTVWAGGKGRPHEGGTRVPFILRWPGQIPAGRVYPAIADVTSLLPTLAAVGGVSAPSNVDGMNLLPEWLGNGGNPRHWIYVHYSADRGDKADLLSGEWVRNEQYKLTRVDKCQIVSHLYDTRNDRLERNPIPWAETTAAQRKVWKALQPLFALEKPGPVTKPRACP